MRPPNLERRPKGQKARRQNEFQKEKKKRLLFKHISQCCEKMEMFTVQHVFIKKIKNMWFCAGNMTLTWAERGVSWHPRPTLVLLSHFIRKQHNHYTLEWMTAWTVLVSVQLSAKWKKFIHGSFSVSEKYDPTSLPNSEVSFTITLSHSLTWFTCPFSPMRLTSTWSLLNIQLVTLVCSLREFTSHWLLWDFASPLHFGVTRSLEGHGLHINHSRVGFRQQRAAF